MPAVLRGEPEFRLSPMSTRLSNIAGSRWGSAVGWAVWLWKSTAVLWKAESPPFAVFLETAELMGSDAVRVWAERRSLKRAVA